MSLLTVGHSVQICNSQTYHSGIHPTPFPMLDTVKLGIPLTEKQHSIIQASADKADSWQWVQINNSTGDILFRRTKGLATTDGQSFHRQLRWDVPYTYSDDARLMIEFSIPKYWYGHNIRLLYDFLAPLQLLKQTLEDQFGLKGKGRLADVETWGLARLDICYAWKLPSQKLAQSYLDSLKRLHFPWKKPIIYPTAILFPGKTYSAKFYLKLPEFMQHDRKEMLKSHAALEWVDYCENLAEGVLRNEITCRQRFLKRQGIRTVADLLKQVEYVEWLENVPPENDLLRAVVFTKVMGDYMKPKIPDDPALAVPYLMNQLENGGTDFVLRSGTNISFEGFRLNEVKSIHTFLIEALPPELQNFEVKPGSIIYQTERKPIAILKGMLTKFIGENARMQPVDAIEAKLMESYKPVKASRLVSFWLYVQKFGSAKTKENYGKRSYYYNRNELKKAGISLIEPPTGNNITVLDRDWLQQFSLEIPSPHATNQYDDWRDSENVLNFVPKVSGVDNFGTG